MNIFTQDQPFQFGMSHYINGGRLGPFNSEHLDLSIILTGKTKVFFDDQVRTIEGCCATCIYNEYQFESIFSRGQETQVIWCHTAELAIPAEHKDRLKSLPNTLPHSDLLLTLLKEGVKLGLSNDVNIARLRNSLAVAAYNEYLRLADLKEEENVYPRAILTAKEFIDTNYLKPCDLDMVADYAAITPHYLISLFKSHMGITPIRYLWQLRGQRGVHLLKQTGMTVSDIAYNCGFSSPHHFSRYIKEHYGHTPRDIRERQWRSVPENLAGDQIVEDPEKMPSGLINA